MNPEPGPPPSPKGPHRSFASRAPPLVSPSARASDKKLSLEGHVHARPPTGAGPAQAQAVGPSVAGTSTDGVQVGRSRDRAPVFLHNHIAPSSLALRPS